MSVAITWRIIIAVFGFDENEIQNDSPTHDKCISKMKRIEVKGLIPRYYCDYFMFP